jgi:hypothetical protein
MKWGLWDDRDNKWRESRDGVLKFSTKKEANDYKVSITGRKRSCPLINFYRVNVFPRRFTEEPTEKGKKYE